ncbi:hypothetical protein K2173_005066 [Erythroxylum novogranatense]|uniref:Uncharacterized protein n=1 Tax=Erythroxylum novogranatense TaxID=1862640 RepID=A0AAV8TD53_9ROSI|nr:hypothetical protein K2173_005066 [Erythroxylum novogranatense]
MAYSVHVKEATMIKPSDTTPSRLLSLSALDSQLFLRFTVEYLFVYKSRPGLDQNITKSRLKTSLSKILVPYYPMAGRVRAKSGGSGLEVVCKAQGAVFIEATSDCTIKDFDRAPTYVTQWRKLLSVPVTDVLKGDPVVVVQLTWLKDGAATLGVGINHCVCDGIGGGEFLNSLASLAAFECRVTDLKPKPVWDRQLLDPIKPPRPYPVNHQEFNRVPDLGGFISRFSKERLIPTSVSFDKRCLNELKRAALRLSTTQPSGLTFTSFEVLSAHVWRSWARALNLPPNQMLKLLFSINIRNRVKPSLPSGYYGNAFVLGCAQASVKDLSEKGLGYASLLIKNAKDRVNNDYVRSVVQSVSLSRASPDSVGVLIMSQWSRLGLEMVDFGMGRPVHVGPICCDRYCLIVPVHSQTDAVKVVVAVPASSVDKYECLVQSAHM